MALTNPYIFDVSSLDDSVILETDAEGKELLRFQVHWAGKAVQVRHPTQGQWNAYRHEVATILIRIAPDFDGLDFPELHGKVELKASAIAYSLALLIDQPSVGRAISDCFFTYLRPTVDGLSESETKQWMSENAPLDGVVRLLIGMLSPIDSVKKNILYHLRETFLRWIIPPSWLYAPKSGNTPPKPSQQPAHSLSNFA